jgi:hypothetical protein
MNLAKSTSCVVMLATLMGCTFGSGPEGDNLGLPIVVEVVVNEHTTLGSPNGTDDALNMANGEVVSTATDELFADIGFQITSEGKAVALSTIDLGTNVNGTHELYLQILPGAFGQDAVAPETGWSQDRKQVEPNQLVFTKLLRLNSCGPDKSKFAKIAVDSVNVTTRKLYLHVLINPNCGATFLNPPAE